MRRVGQVRKRDDNERQIIDALEAIGLTVIPLSAPGCPDLLVWRQQDGFRLLEVKQPRGRMTALQERAVVPFTVVRSVDQALALFGMTVTYRDDVFGPTPVYVPK